MMCLLFLLMCGPWAYVVAACIVFYHGSRNELFLQGTVLSSYGPLPGGYVHIRDGRIAGVGEKHGPIANTGHATMMDCGSSVITPGFINTHEHVEYSLISPLPDNGERFRSRNEWRLGLNNKTKMDPEVIAGTEANATIWGELRHLFSGTTSIIGEGYAAGLARNLDRDYGLEKGLHAPAASMENFPLNDRSGILRLGDCDYGPAAVTQGATDRLHRYIAHVGEGVSAEAKNEFRCVSSQTFDTMPRADGSGVSVDLLASNFVLVQANSLTERDFDMVAQRGSMVVWSPRSNVALYGTTLNVTYLLESGITVALGTDWLPSGSATMSREAYCAAQSTLSIYNITIEPRSLWRMMTIDAAKVAGFEHHLGSLDVGKLADIAVWSGDKNLDAFGQAIFTPTEGLELVMRGGEILLAGSSMHPLLKEEDCESVFFGTVNKRACVKKELNMSFAAFQSALQGKYPSILSGVVPNEPSCVAILG